MIRVCQESAAGDGGGKNRRGSSLLQGTPQPLLAPGAQYDGGQHASRASLSYSRGASKAPGRERAAGRGHRAGAIGSCTGDAVAGARPKP